MCFYAYIESRITLATTNLNALSQCRDQLPGFMQSTIAIDTVDHEATFPAIVNHSCAKPNSFITRCGGKLMDQRLYLLQFILQI